MRLRRTVDRENFQWPEGKRVAVSLSYDDARGSQLDAGLPIMDRHDVKATFYVSLANTEGRVDDWRAAAANGHEIGNHSLCHTCSGNFNWRNRRALEDYTVDEIEAELIEANERIGDMFGAPATTFAYPCGQSFVGRGVERRSYVPAVARRFLAGRGFRDEYLNDPVFCDLAKLGGTELDGVPFEELVEMTERAASRGVWVVFAGHDVADKARHQVVLADVLDRYCTWCKNAENGVWIDTVARIAKYVQQQRECA